MLAGRFKADRFNLLRNRASALVGAKKKAKEADGETDVVRVDTGVLAHMSGLT